MQGKSYGLVLKRWGRFVVAALAASIMLAFSVLSPVVVYANDESSETEAYGLVWNAIYDDNKEVVEKSGYISWMNPVDHDKYSYLVVNLYFNEDSISTSIVPAIEVGQGAGTSSNLYETSSLERYGAGCYVFSVQAYIVSDESAEGALEFDGSWISPIGDEVYSDVYEYNLPSTTLETPSDFNVDLGTGYASWTLLEDETYVSEYAIKYAYVDDSESNPGLGDWSYIYVSKGLATAYIGNLFSSTEGNYIFLKISAITSDLTQVASSENSEVLGPYSVNKVSIIGGPQNVYLDSDLVLHWDPYTNENVEGFSIRFATAGQDPDAPALDGMNPYIEYTAGCTGADLKTLEAQGYDYRRCEGCYIKLQINVITSDSTKYVADPIFTDTTLYTRNKTKVAAPTNLQWGKTLDSNGNLADGNAWSISWETESTDVEYSPEFDFMCDGKSVCWYDLGENLSIVKSNDDKTVWSADFTSVMPLTLDSGEEYYIRVRNVVTEDIENYSNSDWVDLTPQKYVLATESLPDPSGVTLSGSTLSWDYGSDVENLQYFTIGVEKGSHTDADSLNFAEEFIDKDLREYDLSPMLTLFEEGDVYTVFIKAISSDRTAILDSEFVSRVGKVETSSIDPSPSIPSSGNTGSSTTTTVKKNDDGSTTTTVTNSVTGVKTETTKQTDGTVVEKVIEKSGAATTTTTLADGTSSTIKFDSNGTVVSVTATVSAKAASGDEAIVLPLEAFAATEDADSAVAIEVSVPSSADSITVVVPIAEDSPAGTTLVRVKADGTTDIIPKVATTDEGLAVTLSEGETLKVIDASIDFPDVSNSSWYSDAAQFASSRGLLTGAVKSDGTAEFQGDSLMTRAMLVTVLNRLESSPEASESSSFIDVDDDSWYSNSVTWASENGIVSGYSNSAEFGPNDGVTREQMAVMLYRYASMLGLDVSSRADLSSYSDADELTYGADAMSWAVSVGLIKGYGGTTELGGSNGLTRAECAVVLQRLVNLIV